MDPGIVLGRARVALFVGMGAVVAGLGLGSAVAAWAGVALVAVAFAANAAAKVSHFRTLPLSPERRTRLAAVWVFFSVGVVALVAASVARRTTGVETEAFWPLVVAVAALGAAYRYFQGQYLDEEMAAGE
ncbi:MAG: hypothetical protein ABEJ90_04260 [Halobacterium sp.]